MLRHYSSRIPAASWSVRQLVAPRSDASAEPEIRMDRLAALAGLHEADAAGMKTRLCRLVHFIRHIEEHAAAAKTEPRPPLEEYTAERASADSENSERLATWNCSDRHFVARPRSAPPCDMSKKRLL